MAKIKLSEPNGPYSCTIDTDVMNVELRNAFLGIKFVTEDGEMLSVSMRDQGFEIGYFTDGTEQWFSLNVGEVKKL